MVVVLSSLMTCRILLLCLTIGSNLEIGLSICCSCLLVAPKFFKHIAPSLTLRTIYIGRKSRSSSHPIRNHPWRIHTRWQNSTVDAEVHMSFTQAGEDKRKSLEQGLDKNTGARGDSHNLSRSDGAIPITAESSIREAHRTASREANIVGDYV